ncbi:hypothetical protein ACFV2N_05480 [Streptomyces sp. NPDC059680]
MGDPGLSTVRIGVVGTGNLTVLVSPDHPCSQTDAYWQIALR